MVTFAVVSRVSQPQPSHQCPKAFSRAISIWSPPLITQYLLSPWTSSQDHSIFFAIAKRGWSTVNTGTFPRFTYSVASAMTSMPCFTNASECALSWNNGMSPDIVGGLREASCNVVKCADQEILSCAPNVGFFDNSLTTFAHDSRCSS